MNNELKINIASNGRVDIVINSVQDAIELQAEIGRAIAMAMANGDSGRCNTIPAGIRGLRVEVLTGDSERRNLGHYIDK